LCAKELESLTEIGVSLSKEFTLGSHPVIDSIRLTVQQRIVKLNKTINLAATALYMLAQYIQMWFIRSMQCPTPACSNALQDTSITLIT
jgi:hypothetical protein